MRNLNFKIANDIIDALKLKYTTVKVSNIDVTRYCILADIEKMLSTIQNIGEIDKDKFDHLLSTSEVRICSTHFTITLDGLNYTIERSKLIENREMIKNHPNFHAVQFTVDVINAYIKAFRVSNVKTIGIPEEIITQFVMNIEDFVDKKAESLDIEGR